MDQEDCGQLVLSNGVIEFGPETKEKKVLYGGSRGIISGEDKSFQKLCLPGASNPRWGKNEKLDQVRAAA
ncbi:hypothetical protein [Paenibacillus sp.]|jgi:hypothetical protein|uniref:hypothetical protein n=1 Tax=Paenibacillus sp. TaxID=58172 RepID=UPI00282A1C18|nr:hypothetical protein [Paenibacillus sp.]MDR0269181.1 hypothetical protein [Paenibacillus sp.]